MVLNKKYEIYNRSNKESKVVEPKSDNYARFEIQGNLDLRKLILKDEIKGSGIKKLYAPDKIEINSIDVLYHDKQGLFHFEINLEEGEKELGILIKEESKISVKQAKSKLEKYLNTKLKKINKN